MKAVFKNRIKIAALIGVALSVTSLLVHLLLAKHSSQELVQYKFWGDNFRPTGQWFRHGRLWGSISSLANLQPYATPRSIFPVRTNHNRFIYAKVHGGFEKIKSAICDLVAISRLLNATLILPEIQASLLSKGISPKFKGFSYIYNEEQFIAALANDVIVLRSLPESLKKQRKKNAFPTLVLKRPEEPSFYLGQVLAKLEESSVVGLVIINGGCLKAILPSSMAEYQRLRCRVAFHALQFRPEILALGNQIVERLRAFGRPYIAFHPGLLRDTLAFHGCAELFQDVHTELIQYRRKQMIKRGVIHDKLEIDSMARKMNGSCPLMPEEVGLLLRAMGYPSSTVLYVAGSETFGGQRVLIPLRAMFPNLMDRISLCSKKELTSLLGPEPPRSSNRVHPPPFKSEKQLMKEWMESGPKPRPLPPPPARPFYQYEKEGWYGWVTESDDEPEPSPMDLRLQANRLIWDALDYHVSVEADAFIPGFHNDGSGWPDFSSLVMGHRLYEMASSITFRPDRKILAELFDKVRDDLYHPSRNWTILVRKHLNSSLGIHGLVTEANTSKPNSFLSHPLPECSCTTSKTSNFKDPSTDLAQGLKIDEQLYGGVEQCPEWMVHGLAMVLPRGNITRDDDSGEKDLADDIEAEGLQETDDNARTDRNTRAEADEETDPDD